MDSRYPAGVLYFLLKLERKQDFKVVLKSASAKPCLVEFDLLKDAYLDSCYDMRVNPPAVAFPAHGAATAVLTVRGLPGGEPRPAAMRCLLVAKLKNSSAKFTFPCVFTYPLAAAGCPANN